MQKRENMQRVITEEIKLLMGVKVFIKQFLHISLAKAMKLDLAMLKTEVGKLRRIGGD